MFGMKMRIALVCCLVTFGAALAAPPASAFPRFVGLRTMARSLASGNGSWVHQRHQPTKALRSRSGSTRVKDPVRSIRLQEPNRVGQAAAGCLGPIIFVVASVGLANLFYVRAGASLGASWALGLLTGGLIAGVSAGGLYALESMDQ